MRAVARLLAYVAVLAVVLFAASPARAQECLRQCAAELRDANGCCPAPAPSHPRAAPSAQCTGGKETSPDTSGHCCWHGQVWTDGHCVGVPTECPAKMNLKAAEQTCELPACGAGQKRASDGVSCCWPGQGWSHTRSACVGVPQCPKGMEVEGADHCVSVDKDGDGIPNATDQCPDQAEDFNGYKDEDGCPDEPERLAMVKAAHDREAAAQLAAQQEAERQRQVAAAEEARRQAILAEQKRAADAAAESARLAQVAAEEARVAKANARTSRRRAGYALTSIGLAFGVTSGVFMGLGAGENSTIKSGGFASASDIASADSSGKTYNAAAIATGVLGILGVGIGAPLILADLPTHEATEPPPPSARAGDVFLTPTAGGLSVHGVF